MVILEKLNLWCHTDISSLKLDTCFCFKDPPSLHEKKDNGDLYSEIISIISYNSLNVGGKKR